MENLKGKIALVTGAGHGIGRAICQRFAALGMKIIAASKGKQNLEETAALLGQDLLFSVLLDVSDRAQVAALGERLAREGVVPDILVNNAGFALGLEPLQQGNMDEWDLMIQANVLGLLYVTRTVLPLMIKAGRGHVLTIGSVAGRTPYPGGNVYCASKAAAATLNQALNLDLAGTLIRASNIEPGMVKTAFSNTRFGGDAARAESVYRGVDALSAEDIAEIAAFVVSMPAHVNIQDLLVMPTQQRNPFVLSRREE